MRVCARVNARVCAHVGVCVSMRVFTLTHYADTLQEGIGGGVSGFMVVMFYNSG